MGGDDARRGPFEHRADGSIWELVDGRWRAVVPPGADGQAVRFAARTVPLVDLATALARDIERNTGRHGDAMEELARSAGCDDLAVVEAAWLLERAARTDGRPVLARAAELLAESRAEVQSRHDQLAAGMCGA